MLSYIWIPVHLINTIISATAILMGTLIGALFSWIISKKTTVRNIEEQYKLMKENRNYEEFHKQRDFCANANIVRLDICTALFQSIRTLKDYRKGDLQNKYPIPINKDYSCVVSTLTDKYTLKELSYIYQFYGIIEKVNYDILNCDLYDENCFKKIIGGYEDILKKIYGSNFEEILSKDIDAMSYEELYDNDLTKKGYRTALQTLDKLCIIENEG